MAKISTLEIFVLVVGGQKFREFIYTISLENYEDEGVRVSRHFTILMCQKSMTREDDGWKTFF